MTDATLQIIHGLGLQPLGEEILTGNQLIAVFPGGGVAGAFCLSVSKAGALAISRDFFQLAMGPDYEGPLPGDTVN